MVVTHLRRLLRESRSEQHVLRPLREYTFELNAYSMDPLQMVALATRSREGFEKCENNAIELVGIFY